MQSPIIILTKCVGLLGSSPKNLTMSILARLVILCFVFHTWHATASAAAKNDGSVDGIRVAIVGAGIGGSAAAYYLRQELAKLDRNADVKIDVYESSDRTCGRMMAMDVEGQRYEVGAAVAHPKNQYMAELLAAAGLKKLAADAGDFGLVLKPGQYVSLGNALESWSEDLHLLERYGTHVVELDLLLAYLFNQFTYIYHMQAQKPRQTFATLSEFLDTLPTNFTTLCHEAFGDYLKGRGLPDQLVNELVSATVQAVYNQDTNVITALSGMTALARSANDKYWSVLGGNEILCQHLLEKSNVSVLLQTPVARIRYVSNTSLAVGYTENHVSHEAEYDIVILATPLIKGEPGIAVTGFPAPLPTINPGAYQETTTTLVKGDVNLKYFGLEENDNVPWLFAMPFGNDLPVTLIENTPPVDGKASRGSTVWKMQSTVALNSTSQGRAFLDAVFPNRSAVVSHTFLRAYPHFTSPDSLGPLRFAKNLFYNSGIEWASSAMEMSCISAKNSVLMAIAEIKSQLAP